MLKLQCDRGLEKITEETSTDMHERQLLLARKAHLHGRSPQRQNSGSCQTPSLFTLLPFLRRRYIPYPPEFEVLITRACAYHVARWANTAKQHARIMSIADLCHAVE